MPSRLIKPITEKILPIVLAGGSGSRLWPASRPDCPKQFIKLGKGLSLFQQSLMRCSNSDLFRAPIIVVGQTHQHLAQKQVEEVGILPAAIISEPLGRDTAAAITLGALAAYDSKNDGQLVAVLPSDHSINDQRAFDQSITQASMIARRSGLLVTFGIQADRPETGYGYIRTGAPLHGYDGYMVRQFVEKPNKIRARQYVSSGDYLWNSGMFLFPLVTYFSELALHAPEVFLTCERAMSASRSDGYVIYPDRAAIAGLKKISIDYALMEKTGLAAVLPMSPGWSDLGTWNAIWDHSERDEYGNASVGDVELREAKNSYAHSSGPLTTLVGVKDCVVVATKDAVLVAARDQADQIKQMVGDLKKQGRSEVRQHPGEIRPWGSFAPLHNGAGHQVKIIEVNPGGQLSLQKHRRRAEHWIIVAGIATVTVGEERKELVPGQHAHVPLGAVHRLENFGQEPVQMIEVQTGDYFGEDDIIRLEDVYDREAEPGKNIDA